MALHLLSFVLRSTEGLYSCPEFQLNGPSFDIRPILRIWRRSQLTRRAVGRESAENAAHGTRPPLSPLSRRESRSRTGSTLNGQRDGPNATSQAPSLALDGASACACFEQLSVLTFVKNSSPGVAVENVAASYQNSSTP